MVEPPPTEHVTRDQPAPAGASWWDRYSRSLDAASISPTARTVIQDDSEYIVKRAVLGAGRAGDDRWPDGRVRRGVVMGAVQSGKTASMLGVTALSLDAGVDMVVILAGTRVSLWRQSLERMLRQLDRVEGESVAERAQRRILVPDPALAMSDDADRSPSRLYTINGPTLTRTLSTGRPVLALALKNAQHLRAMADVMRRRVLSAVEQLGNPFYLLVIDDEADDGSILDARIEQQVDPALRDLKQIPRAIVDLWESRPHTGETASPHLFATYIGYTATPQANFLQSDHNPLAPTDFAIALRTPFDQGEVTHRSSTYREPKGIAAFYTGGETYYRRLSESPICQPTSGSPPADLRESIRAFLVAGAIRLWRDNGRLGPATAGAASFESRDDAIALSPAPHSMLFHPSAAIADQFDAAARILEVTCGTDPVTSRALIETGQREFPVDAVEQMIAGDEPAWQRWLGDFSASAHAVETAFDLPQPRPVPDASEWPQIRALLLEEIIPATRIKIVNSDPRADDRPQFDPVQVDGHSWQAPPDLCTVFVSGNVMSRGLTLEGLTTTLFLRSADEPFADTQMQMQRWFGFRGGYIDLCRVFVAEPQLELFRAYHDVDEALRRTVLAAMDAAGDDAPAPVVLQGQDFMATGKLANLSNLPLCPGATPFIRLVNPGQQADPNVELVARTFTGVASSDVVAADVLRGRALDEPLSLNEAAALLDQLQYDEYRPTTSGWEGARWQDLEAKVGIDPSTDFDGVLPFFRPPVVSLEDATPYSLGGPYAISAYLRLWKACLSRHASGLVATDDPRIPWSMLDLEERFRDQPLFYVGIRYGDGPELEDGAPSELPFRIRSTRRSIVGGELVATWGSRNPGDRPGAYLGDQLFDYHHHHKPAPPGPPLGSTWRPVGAPGLILFYVVSQDDRPFPTVAVGAAIPLGGPDQFAARAR